MLSTHDVRRAVRYVLEAERARKTSVSITFLSAQQMRALNRSSFGRDRATDVIAFQLRHQGHVIGDVYVCSSVARQSAAREGIGRREEEMRLVVHGVLHALGYEHSRGANRVKSGMWRRQERYLNRLGVIRGR